MMKKNRFLGLVTLCWTAASLAPPPAHSNVSVSPALEKPSATEEALNGEDENPSDASTSSSSSSTTAESVESKGFLQRLNANYFAILYGPSIGKPSSYQPSPYGPVDRAHPLLVQNFLGLGYSLTDAVTITPTAFWHWEPVLGQTFTLKDPFLRVSHNSVISTEKFNLYSDLRTHFAVTPLSRENDLRAGVQTLQVATYQVGDSHLVAGLYGSARVNVFGSQGRGNDLELYLGPNLTYSFSDQFSLTLLYEMAANHEYGAEAFDFYSAGTDLEPGFSWQITPRLSVNPYLNLTTGGRVNWETTSVGMLLNLQLI